MTISVVIPTFNQADTLSQTIESVLDQTRLPKNEIIVVIDGSKDGSLTIAKSYDVKVISQVNKGLSSARNTGIMNATGDWILFLDSDDILKPNCLERIEQVINKNPDADIVAPSFKEFGVRDTEIILMENPTIKDFIVANRIGYFSAIRRSALLEVGGYSPRMIYGYEDLHLWFDLLSRGKKLVTIPEMLVLYRTKPNSMIHTAMAHHAELMNQIRKDFPQIYQ